MTPALTPAATPALALARRALTVIGALTVATGATQLVAPALVLGLVGGDASPAPRFFFRIVGMFMVLFGGLMWHTVRASRDPRVPLLWCALQKLGAAAVVTAGVVGGHFARIAMLVAAFDLASGVLALWYRRRAAR